MLVSTVCPHCNAEFMAAYKYKNGVKQLARFCSTECYFSWLKGGNDASRKVPKKERFIVNCSGCRKELSLAKWQYENKTFHFCSKECFKLHAKELGIGKIANDKKYLGTIEVFCNICNKSIIKRVGIYNANKSKIFYCSKKCQGESQGRKMLDGTHQLIGSRRYSGEENSRWNNGITSLLRNIRRKPENALWKRECIKRDENKCVLCNSTISLVVHHKTSLAHLINRYNIKTYEDTITIPEMYNINNGVTLCKSCHHSFHTTYGKAFFTEENFNEFYNKNILK